MKSRIKIFLSILFGLTSCTTVNLTTRKDKDFQLLSSDFEKLNGIYKNAPTDSNNLRRTLFCIFLNNEKDTICRQKQYSVKVISSDPKSLTLSLIDQGISIRTLKLYGKYKDGYFKVNRQYLIDGLVGPLAWIFGEHINYIGLSKTNNLIIFDSGGVGVLFIIVFPFFVAGGNRRDYEYIRTK